MHKLVEEARAGLADGSGDAASGAFAPPQLDKEYLAREKIRLEIVREVFDADSDATEAARPALARKLARLLRLS